MWIDTHCHLDASEFDADRANVAAQALANGVRAIVIPAVGRDNFSTVRTLAHAIPGGVYALGIHPMYVAHALDDDLVVLRDAVRLAINDPRFIGIGEIGLDFFDPAAIAVADRQERFYETQLRIAVEFDLPVILHVRRSQDRVLRQLRRMRPRGGFAHAFNGSQQQADAFVALNFKLGIGGAMTFERALQIRRLALHMPLEHLVLETDAPDIPPAWIRPGRNSPAELPAIGYALAALRGLEPEQVARVTTANAYAVLPKLAALHASQATS
ncbi:MAG TPA: TatD family hydrolase [Burkholderiaceae bacterium]|nr:TatD family hydrolase [Burkholderiaceae bacterium]